MERMFVFFIIVICAIMIAHATADIVEEVKFNKRIKEERERMRADD